MNKPKYQVTNRARKKMNKEIRSSTLQPTPEPKSNAIKGKNLLSRYPKKIQKKEERSLKSFKKNLNIKKKKSHTRQSKRTSPGSPGTDQRDAAPHIAHVEGKRWMQTTETKIQANNKVGRRHSLKKKGR